MNKHIALIHQDEEIAKYYKKILIDNGYKVTNMDSGIKLVNNLHQIGMDLVIASYELADIDGQTLYTQICEEFPNLPIVLVGSIRDETLITKMLMFENCEFMLQPVVPVELLARIKALLMPIQENCDDKGNLEVKDLILDTQKKHAKRGKKEIILTPTEYRLLEYLMENKGNVLSRDMILNKVWKTTEDISDRVVDVYIGYLREKIDDNFKDKLIETVTGFGYKIG